MPLQDVQGMSRFCARTLLVVLVLSALALLGTVNCVFHGFLIPKEARDPLLDNGGFTLLAIVVALSAYLRSVASAADEKREKIRSGESKLYRPGEAHTIEKLDVLDKSYDQLQVVAPLMIWLTLSICFRLFLETLARFGFYWLNIGLVFRIYDMLILEWLMLTLLALAILHYFSYRRDERLRSEALAAHPDQPVI